MFRERAVMNTDDSTLKLKNRVMVYFFIKPFNFKERASKINKRIEINKRPYETKGI